ncbi:MAG TPA: hypothetical protein VGS01_05815 [Candidatus Limnocylindria bacterium]|jgi:hypothetical protein|nr:hypothetical protein [Candidatus Limnocylindria bacterium]
MRGVVFVLAAIVATAGAIVAYDKLRPSDQHAASQGASSSSQSGDPTTELASRLLTPSYLPDGGTYEVRLYPTQLPPDPKVDLPLPAGARLVGSALRLRNGTAASLDAVLDVPATTRDVAGFYDRELGKLGWAPAPNRGPTNQGGFVQTFAGLSRMYCKGEQPPWYSVSVYTPTAAPIDVRAHVEFTNPNVPAGGSYVGPCSAQPQGVQMGGGLNKLPALKAPDGVILRGGMGGMSGNDRQSSEAGATTKLSASDLEAQFAQQLAAAGWTKVARGADGPIAWSTWKIPGDGDWRGLLLVNETSGDRRSLLVRAEAN